MTPNLQYIVLVSIGIIVNGLGAAFATGLVPLPPAVAWVGVLIINPLLTFWASQLPKVETGQPAMGSRQ